MNAIENWKMQHESDKNEILFHHAPPYPPARTHLRSNCQVLRQGDPSSPLLFNLVSDALATMLKRGQIAGTLKGVVPHLIEGGLNHLQYADDTIIFLDFD